MQSPDAYRARAMLTATGFAPGRINLIGEHTDYNDGLVMPIALRLGVTVEAIARDDKRVQLTTDASVAPREGSYELGAERRDGTWVDRVKGITAIVAREGTRISGFDASVRSDLPVGAGLGSSAAFAIALLRAISELFDLALDDASSARIAHTAESEFAGARAGMLDQLASAYGRPSDALLIDIRDHATEVIPLSPSIELAVIDSGTRHEHATGGYNRRRAECEEACLHLGIASLREIDDRPMDEILERLPAPLDRRVRHVVTENARVRGAVAAVRARDATGLGELLSASHRSLRDDYEVSTPELDRLVQLAAAGGAFGARMVGGGFGGSVIALTLRGRGRDLAAQVLKGYGGDGHLVAVVP
jgi:galactokinase